MNISEVSTLTEVSSKMIRRYEEMGIIPKAGRSFSGYRQYGEKDVHLLKFVKRSRELGFSLKDIKELLSLWQNKRRSSSQVKKICMVHKIELERKLKDIQEMLNTLDHLVNSCHGDNRPDCPILDELECHK